MECIIKKDGRETSQYISFLMQILPAPGAHTVN